MPPKQKPNGFAMYVSEQCKKTNIPYHVGFTKFSAAWQSLDKTTQEIYKERAKELKALATSTGITTPPMFGNRSPTKNLSSSTRRSLDRGASGGEMVNGNRKRYLEEMDGDENELEEGEVSLDTGIEDDSDEEMPPPPPLPPSAPPNSMFKRRYVGEGQDQVVYVLGLIEADEMEEEEARQQEKTFPEDHMRHVLDAYADFNDVEHSHVFVLSCTPVIFAQGFKKAANRPVNRPVEIGMTAFSISAGLEKVYLHEFVDPGPVPVPETCHANESRLERHGIPTSLAQMDDEESASFYREGFVLSKNYYDIVLAILRFMGYDGINEEVLPPVLVPQTMIETTELCFRWIVTQAMREAIEKKLPALPQLSFGTLNDFIHVAHYVQLNRSGNSMVFPDYERQLSDVGRTKSLPQRLKCPFHQKFTSVKLCALGAAREASYIALCSLKDTYELPNVEPFMYSGDTGDGSDSDEE